ncbi:mobilome CxxCx(11)CxxC protein [Stenotrophomonas sp.]|uniref:mobilome CxxCx(11)CxxC protein n=1 Tax=Stenotrophomonas sp. TaxID=69392 RepID=UPI0028AAA9F3|nr:mobilome CxxCx(11)CxxC protein [Stenotrophomonas sp.]
MEEQERNACWNRACDCFATAKIFERRARVYQVKIDAVTYLGVGGPAIFGAAVAAWGADVLSNAATMIIVGLVGVAQVALSVAALVRNWPENYAYSKQSAAINYQLAEEFKDLAVGAGYDAEAFRIELQRAVARDRSQTQQDTGRHVSDREKTWGHRHGLRQFQRSCLACNVMPTDMKPTTCHQCGEF